MRFKVGDRVRIKSLDWYNENKDEYGYVDCGSRAFFTKMSDWCGKIATIKEICKTNCYRLEEYDFDWTDEMIEGLVEEEVGLVDMFSSRWVNEFNLPYGYIFKDENGNVINATKIVLEKKKVYPKTYEECCKVLGIEGGRLMFNNSGITQYERDLYIRMNDLSKLIICRDAYWKIAGEEMGLGKPWEPDFDNLSTNLEYIKIVKGCFTYSSRAFAFSTEEMRDAFKENFKSEIEFCKEFL